MSLLTKKTSPSETMNSNPPVMPTTSRSPSFRSSSSKAPVAHVRSPSGRGNSGLSRPRGSGRRPSPNPSALTTNTNVSDDISEEDARAENAGIMEELRDRLRKAEIASEEYQRHLSMLQTRLDDSLHQQGTLEDRVQEGIGRIEELEFENNQSARQKRELECQIESERTTMTKDKNEQKVKEEELLSVNQRLKETLAQREMRYNVDEDKISTRSRRSMLPLLPLNTNEILKSEFSQQSIFRS